MKRRSFIGGLLALPVLAKLRPIAPAFGRSAAITITAAVITPPRSVAEGIAGARIFAGMAVYLRCDGKWAPCDVGETPLGLAIGTAEEGNGMNVFLTS